MPSPTMNVHVPVNVVPHTGQLPVPQPVPAPPPQTHTNAQADALAEKQVDAEIDAILKKPPHNHLLTTLLIVAVLVAGYIMYRRGMLQRLADMLTGDIDAEAESTDANGADANGADANATQPQPPLSAPEVKKA